MPPANTYLDFLRVAKNYHNPSLDNLIKDELNHQHPFSHHFQSPNVSFLTNLVESQYVYMHKNVRDVIGYKADDFLAEGLGFYFELMHPVDFELYNRKVFPEYLKILSGVSPAEFYRYLFSRSNRIINRKTGETQVILQKFYFIPDKKSGQPLAVHGSVTDITNFSYGEAIVQTIEYFGPDQQKRLIYKKSFYYDEEKMQLTSQQLELVKLMAEGLSSKQIADRLNLGIHTINNHRKNMLAKTGCQNATELVRKAIATGII